MSLIIPIFIMHRGCVHRCTFCNQQKAAGPYPEDISEAYFRETVIACLQRSKGPSAGSGCKQVQIAFYGGNFTGMAREDQVRLLEYAQPFLETGQVGAARISTRPDCVDQKRLDLIKGFGVQIVEIGAQSLVDEVLRRNERGHTAADVEAAVGLLQANGLQVCVHLMAGLPGDSAEGFACSVERVIAMRPQMVRIHPTLVLAGTRLDEEFRNGRYEPLTLDAAIMQCKSALLKFAAAGIPVIRVGLQTTPEMEKRGTVVAGPYHPAFRSLVESSIFFDRAAALLSTTDVQGKQVVFTVGPREESNLRGMKNENIHNLQTRFGVSGIRICPDPAQPAGMLHLSCSK